MGLPRKGATSTPIFSPTNSATTNISPNRYRRPLIPIMLLTQGNDHGKENGPDTIAMPAIRLQFRIRVRFLAVINRSIGRGGKKAEVPAYSLFRLLPPPAARLPPPIRHHVAKRNCRALMPHTTGSDGRISPSNWTNGLQRRVKHLAQHADQSTLRCSPADGSCVAPGRTNSGMRHQTARRQHSQGGCRTCVCWNSSGISVATLQQDGTQAGLVIIPESLSRKTQGTSWGNATGRGVDDNVGRAWRPGDE